MSKSHPTDEPSQTPSQARRLDTVCNRFEDDWRAGKRPRIEDYLVDVSEAERSALLRELIALDIAYRRKSGEALAPDAYDHLGPTSINTGDGGGTTRDAAPSDGPLNT